MLTIKMQWHGMSLAFTDFVIYTKFLDAHYTHKMDIFLH